MLKLIFCIGVFSQLAIAQELPFDQALHEMIDANVDVRIQRTKMAASESQLWAARGVFLPTLSLQAQQANSSDNGVATSMINASSAQVYSAAANWNVFRGGADVAGVHAAVSDRSFQYSELDDVSLQAETKAGQALLDLIENKLAVEVYRRSEKNAREFLDIADARFKKSLLPHEELDKVALDAANAESKRADAERQFNSTRANVEALLGHSRVKLEWPWENHLNSEDIPELKNSWETAVTTRPDLRAATIQLDTDEYKSKNLYRTMFASVDLNFTQSLMQMPGVRIPGWSSTATLTIPLWNDYHDYSAYKVQVENKRASEARVQQTRKNVESDVRTAQDNFRVTLQQYQSRIKNLSIARHILDQDAARFKIGRAAANELNLDLSRVTDAEILAIQGIEEAHLAYMSLKHAFGKPVQ